MNEDLETLTFPNHLDIVKQSVLRQSGLLKKVSKVYADAIEAGGTVHVYANGHSRVSVEELVVRMGALSGFHPLLSSSIATFTDVVGPNGLRINQFFERVEKSGAQLLAEVDFGKNDALLIITATGTTIAAVDIALEFTRQYAGLPLIAIASAHQSRHAAPAHSSGKNLWHVIADYNCGYFIDNGMPYGDLAIEFTGNTGTYRVCPLSSIGALTVIQSLNELTIKELDSRNISHLVLKNMHLDNTSDNYEEWLRDQRKRYALSINNPDRVVPQKATVENEP